MLGKHSQRVIHADQGSCLKGPFTQNTISTQPPVCLADRSLPGSPAVLQEIASGPSGQLSAGCCTTPFFLPTPERPTLNAPRCGSSFSSHRSHAEASKNSMRLTERGNEDAGVVPGPSSIALCFVRRYSGRCIAHQKDRRHDLGVACRQPKWAASVRRPLVCLLKMPPLGQVLQICACMVAPHWHRCRRQHRGGRDLGCGSRNQGRGSRREGREARGQQGGERGPGTPGTARTDG